MLNKLREATRQLHEKLEGNNLAGKIIDHSISQEEYELLLFQNFLAYAKVENAVEKYLPFENPSKAEKIKQDLRNLGITKPETAWDFSFECHSEAEALGASYVVEGSAMGGMMIGKEIPKCGSLQELPEQHFFSGSRESAKGWNQFLKLMRNREFSEEETDAASKKAMETFKLFEAAFKTQFSKY